MIELIRDEIIERLDELYYGSQYPSIQDQYRKEDLSDAFRMR